MGAAISRQDLLHYVTKHIGESVAADLQNVKRGWSTTSGCSIVAWRSWMAIVFGKPRTHVRSLLLWSLQPLSELERTMVFSARPGASSLAETRPKRIAKGKEDEVRKLTANEGLSVDP